MGCGLLNHHGFGICEMWARAEGTPTISANATGTCVTRCCHFCGGGNSICQFSCRVCAIY
jgi:hypothetical protein